MRDDLKICVIGLGYVGAPLLCEIAKKYEICSGFDLSEKRIKELSSLEDSTLELDEDDLKNLSRAELFFKPEKLKKYNFFIITVPTPVDSENNPDLSFLESASSMLAKHMQPGSFVVYESTVYPGVTEEVCIPIIEKESNMQAEKDFYYGYSPERINPGDKTRKVKDIKKVTSGSSKFAAQVIDDFYNIIIEAGTHLAESVKIAEASKVVENAQRDMNIAFVNELSMIFDKLDIDTTQVIKAASSKWNFMELYPGLVGGHCISVDPYYLITKSIKSGHNPELLGNARKINEGMVDFLIKKALNYVNKDPSSANVLVYGLTFKEDCKDTRNSKSFNLAKKCKSIFKNVYAHDDLLVDFNAVDGLKINEDICEELDIIFSLVNHKTSKKYLLNLINSHKNAIVVDLKKIFSSSEIDNKLIHI